MADGISLKSEWERSSTRGFLCYLVSWRFLRKLLFACAVLITILAVYYAYENWRGNRAWREYRSQLIAEGVNLDIHSIVPPQIPDDQNFAATPFLATLFVGKPSATNSDDRWPDLFEKAQVQVRRSPDTTRTRAGERGLTDLFSWQLAFTERAPTNKPISSDTAASATAAAEVVLQSIKIYDPVLEELNAASKR